MNEDAGLTPEELESEDATALPDKEVVSIIDLNADLDLAIDLAAPVDLAVAANANVAAPINAAAGANVLSVGSEATAVGDQGVMIDQNIDADANATAAQQSGIDQSNDVVDDGTSTTIDTGAGALDGSLLNVNVDLDADADVTAPINGAVAANANVAAPINAGVAANIGSIDSDAIAVAEQDAIINQNITGEANANAGQDSEIQQ
jgi:hypothetical protein